MFLANCRVRNYALLGLFGLLAGCGPTSPVDVVMNQSPTDLKIGGTNVIHEAAAAPSNVTIYLPSEQFSGPVEPPIPPQRALPLPSVGDCGTSVLTHTSDAATANAPFAPAAGTYPFRLKGNYDTDGVKGDFPARVTRTIENVKIVQSAGNLYDSIYTFDVRETRPAGKYVQYTYEVAPENVSTNVLGSLIAAGVPANDPAGVYLLRIESNDPSSLVGASSFTATPPLRILPIPAAVSQAWTDNSADSSTNSSLSLTGSVIQRSLVDACGYVLESWQVHLTGTLSSISGRNASIDMLLGIGTEYGGFILSESIIESGSTAGALDFLQETSSISTLPKEPQQ